MAANPEIEDYIYKSAMARGINPEIALRVARAEALNVFDPSKPDHGGDEGSSFGPFQLHYAGMSKSMPNAGLGDEFTMRTGLDARDPRTWRQQVDFSLDWAKNKGWTSWMGATAAGVGPMEGITGAASSGTGTASAAAPSSAVAMATDDGPQMALDDAVAMRNSLAAEAAASSQPKSLLADTLASSVGGQKASGGGGFTPDATDQPVAEAPLVDFAASAVPETVAPGAEPRTVPGVASPTETASLSDLFKVKNIGLPNEIDPVTGEARPFRPRRAYG